mmetsp:Transcript_80166/g.228386  ORF Transcript_80166/g.228386 Transcript_80166/m.228386 type:complete len:144 (+) Transcript_80166:192-623(+)
MPASNPRVWALPEPGDVDENEETVYLETPHGGQQISVSKSTIEQMELMLFWIINIVILLCAYKVGFNIHTTVKHLPQQGPRWPLFGLVPLLLLLVHRIFKRLDDSKGGKIIPEMLPRAAPNKIAKSKSKVEKGKGKKKRSKRE